MDGTGLLFQPFLDIFPEEIETQVITYPCNEKLSYQELISYVQDNLPKDNDFVMLAESFSGPIAYEISKKENERLKAIIFVASFIQPPNKLLSLAKITSFSFLIPKTLPEFILRFILGSLANKDLYLLINKALSKVSSHVMEFRIKEMAHLSLHIEPITKKCIYIQANKDMLVSQNNADTIEHITECYKFYKIKGSHFLLQVNPDDCSKIIYDELNLLTSSRSASEASPEKVDTFNEK